MRPVFGHMMGMRRDRGMPMEFGIGPEPGGPGGPEHHGGPRDMDVKGRGEERIKDHIVDDMGRELSLSSDQKIKLRKIFDANEPEQLAFHRQMKQQMESFRAKMDAQILQILDDKQKAKFKEFTGRFNRE